ncbi:galacturonosyltransferase [Natronobacillus azotifigens]|uniref:Glycosyltransferase family 4 protein n=1 Tax=Natronobacillus azotifigens TaxID=472978 RepID=A0A9J6RBD3_9BACI|nr:glycosyltransferase family 4 protein [Natronobacillus azotifigens]MCZ0702994.1 glycosyltransferase family 4 protein [Natronobacillus azotifigens]
MKKVLILANNDVGLYKFRKELIEELLKDNKVFISLPDGKFVKELVDLGCEFINTNISRRGTNPITDFKLMVKYKKILDKVKPDIVLSYTIKPNIYGGMMCRLAKTPYISNITGLGTAVENGGLLQKTTIFLYQLALKNASCVFFQNKENADFINSKISIKGKQKVIPGSGVNLKFFKVLDYPQDDVINFLFISRVMKQKGIEQYLDTAEYIKSKYPNTEFHILGFCEESYEEKLKDMTEKGIIQYHGMQSDVRKFYTISHCTIHPTFYPEGMSNVLLESAACGRPVITTNRSGCREIVEDGSTGFIVEEQNSNDIIEKVERFLNMSFAEKKQMGLAGRKKVEKEFNRQVVVDAYSTEIFKKEV